MISSSSATIDELVDYSDIFYHSNIAKIMGPINEIIGNIRLIDFNVEILEQICRTQLYGMIPESNEEKINELVCRTSGIVLKNIFGSFHSKIKNMEDSRFLFNYDFLLHVLTYDCIDWILLAYHAYHYGPEIIRIALKPGRTIAGSMYGEVIYNDKMVTIFLEGDSKTSRFDMNLMLMSKTISPDMVQQLIDVWKISDDETDSAFSISSYFNDQSFLEDGESFDSFREKLAIFLKNSKKPNLRPFLYWFITQIEYAKLIQILNIFVQCGFNLSEHISIEDILNLSDSDKFRNIVEYIGFPTLIDHNTQSKYVISASPRIEKNIEILTEFGYTDKDIIKFLIAIICDSGHSFGGPS